MKFLISWAHINSGSREVEEFRRWIPHRIGLPREKSNRQHLKTHLISAAERGGRRGLKKNSNPPQLDSRPFFPSISSKRKFPLFRRKSTAIGSCALERSGTSIKTAAFRRVFPCPKRTGWDRTRVYSLRTISHGVRGAEGNRYPKPLALCRNSQFLSHNNGSTLHLSCSDYLCDWKNKSIRISGSKRYIKYNWHFAGIHACNNHGHPNI